MIKKLTCNESTVSSDKIIYSGNTATFVIKVPSTQTVTISLLTINNYTTSLTHDVVVTELNDAKIYNINGTNLTGNTFNAKTVNSLSFIEAANVMSVSKNDGGIKITYSDNTTKQYYLYKQVINKNWIGKPQSYKQELINITSATIARETGIIVLGFSSVDMD